MKPKWINVFKLIKYEIFLIIWYIKIIVIFI